MWNVNLREIDALNQRGGRMLSVVDLLERGTIDAGIAAYCIVAVYHGASFLCCALPGGAGKTTLMGALLGLVPSPEMVMSITSASDIPSIRKDLEPTKRNCLVVHEIGKGSWFGYLWGAAVLEYIALKQLGTRLASNIHADTLDQVERQLVSFGGTKDAIAAFDLVLFISRESKLTGRRDGEHVVHAVHERVPRKKNIDATHQRLYTSSATGFDQTGTGVYHQPAFAKQLSRSRGFVESMLDDGTRNLGAIAPRLDEFYRTGWP